MGLTTKTMHCFADTKLKEIFTRLVTKLVFCVTKIHTTVVIVLFVIRSILLSLEVKISVQVNEDR